MNLLDENIPDCQRQLLRSWRIPVRQIGHEVGRQGVKDENIIQLLHRLREVTFFTRDSDFHYRHLCHSNYCLVNLSVGQYEAASFIRRFLRHPEFNKKVNRMGKVVKISHIGIQMWQLHEEEEKHFRWLH